MRAARIGLAGVSLLFFANLAIADFEITYSRENGTGDMIGNWIYRFFARNDGQGQQAGSKSLLCFDYTMESTGAALVLNYCDLDGDGILDANLFGKNLSPNAPTASFFTLGATPTYSFTYPYTKSHLSRDHTAAPYPYDIYNGAKSISGCVFNAGQLDATAAPGQLFGVAVVPAGNDIHVHGQMAGEKGGVYLAAENYVPMDFGVNAGAEQGPPFLFDIFTPEPGSLMALSAGLLLLGIRRRRAA